MKWVLVCGGMAHGVDPLFLSTNGEVSFLPLEASSVELTVASTYPKRQFPRSCSETSGTSIFVMRLYP